MSPMLRAYLIGVGFGVVLTAIVLGTASAIGIPEKWFGSLFLLCAGAASIVGVHLLMREEERSQR